ncbi:hypothetical protein M1367_03570 [Candidatus Marsarchaeota archaeon]|nr:hypothetical protein [Candidatus Marsarchaeota archaeon]
MRMTKIGKAALKKMHFVHCALPDIALNGIDTSMRLNGMVLDAPLLVQAKSKGEAELIERRFGTGAIVLSKSGASIFKDGRSVTLNGYAPCKVGDGLEAAKAIRTENKAVPYITSSVAHKRYEMIKQLRIAMFLTNSKSIAELRKAPIYNG